MRRLYEISVFLVVEQLALSWRSAAPRHVGAANRKQENQWRSEEATVALRVFAPSNVGTSAIRGCYEFRLSEMWKMGRFCIFSV